jgi:phage-related minor tail protein
LAGTIKGITIEIAGDTQPLNKSLEGVNKKTKDLQSELKQVERLLKLDPGNTELLAQKQKLLAEAVENSSDKLKTLKTAQEQVAAQFARGEIGEEQYRAFQREVVKAEQDLSKFEQQLKDVNGAAKKLNIDIKDVGDKLKGVGQGMSVGVTAPIVGGFAAVTQGTRELRMDMGKLEAAFTTAGFTAEQAKDVYFDFYGILGESDTAIEAVNHLAQMTTNQEDLAKWTTIATGVYATFGDSLPIEGLTEAANETAKVGQVTGPLADALNWAGISEDEFNKKLAACSSEQERQALITETLSGKYSAAAEKYREVNAEVIKANEANAKLSDSFAILGATLEPILTPIIEKVTELVNKFNEMDPAGQKIVLVIAGIAAAIGPLLVVIGSLMTALPGLSAAFGVILGPVGLVVAAIAALIATGVLLYKNWDEIKAKAIEIWNFIKEFLGKTWDGIKQAFEIAWNGIKDFFKKWGDELILVAVGPAGWAVLLAKKIAENWEAIKTTALGIWNGLKGSLGGIWNEIKGAAGTAWGNIKEAILSPIRVAKQNIIDIISSIKNAFANMKISFPNIKTPHIKIKWTNVKHIGNIPTDFNVNWYKMGGIFDRPSVIGVGEAGQEAVLPIDKLPTLIAGALREALGVEQQPVARADTGTPIQLVVNLDGRVIAQNLYNLQQGSARGRGIK